MTLDPSYLRAIERLEERPEAAPGADKTWVVETARRAKRLLAGVRAGGLRLWCEDEPLDEPRDSALARRVVDSRATVRATDGRTLDVDLTLTMSGFDFATVWRERRLFRAEGVEIPVARLRHIVESKAAAGRPKDRLNFR